MNKIPVSTKRPQDTTQRLSYMTTVISLLYINSVAERADISRVTQSVWANIWSRTSDSSNTTKLIPARRINHPPFTTRRKLVTIFSYKSINIHSHAQLQSNTSTSTKVIFLLYVAVRQDCANWSNEHKNAAIVIPALCVWRQSTPPSKRHGAAIPYYTCYASRTHKRRKGAKYRW